MLIQCESCQTEFNLDESLLKDEGTKVRCSRCLHVFKAYPPTSDVLNAEVDDRTDSTESDAPLPDPSMDDILSATEKELRTVEDGGADSELESDLDLIYKDVFSGHGGDASDERAEVEDDEFDDLFREAAQGQKETAESPPPVFPAIDSEEPARMAPRKKERVKQTPKAKKRKAPRKAPAPKKAPSKSSRTVLIPILFVVLGIAAAYYVWKADLIPQSIRSLLFPSAETKKAPDTGARLLQFGSVNGSFVDTEKSGPLFVIRGMVTNKYPRNRSYIKIKGSILNSKGVVVLSKTAYAGNTFSEEELKTLAIDEILKAADNRDGMAKQNLNVASGATIPFMVVFAELPDELSEFTVEAVGSSPGS